MKLWASVGAILLALASSPARAHADETTVRASVRTGAATNFIWRGSLAFDPLFAPMSITVAHVAIENIGPGTLYAGYWNGTRFSDGATWPFPYAGYTLVVDALSVDAQYGVFLHTELQPVDREHNFQATVSHGIGRHLRPRVLFSGDPFRLLGVYAQLGCDAIFTHEATTLRVDVSAGVSEYAGAAFAPQDLTFAAELTHALGDGLALSAELTIARALRVGTQLATVGAFIVWSTPE